MSQEHGRVIYRPDPDTMHHCAVPTKERNPIDLTSYRRPHFGTVWLCEGCGRTWVYKKFLAAGHAVPGMYSEGWVREGRIERWLRIRKVKRLLDTQKPVPFEP